MVEVFEGAVECVLVGSEGVGEELLMNDVLERRMKWIWCVCFASCCKD